MLRDHGQRSSIAVILVVPVLLLLVTFLFWYQTWFGRPLSDREMDNLLQNTSVPHKTQHGLAQLGERIARGDRKARRWYGDVLRLASSNQCQFRLMTAWVMGQDNQSEDFHQALRKLVSDPEPMVRRNAALALARFGDASGENELHLMLRPYHLLAPHAGAIHFVSKERDSVRDGARVARITDGSDSKPIEVRSPVAGQVQHRTVPEGAQVVAGIEILVLSPDEEQAWESLRALYLVGKSRDLMDVQPFAQGEPRMSERVRRQAILTIEAIRQRAVTSSPKRVGLFAVDCCFLSSIRFGI